VVRQTSALRQHRTFVKPQFLTQRGPPRQYRAGTADGLGRTRLLSIIVTGCEATDFEAKRIEGERIFEIMYALAFAEEARAAQASLALHDMTASAPVRQRA
jgi:hypothetical protein